MSAREFNGPNPASWQGNQRSRMGHMGAIPPLNLTVRQESRESRRCSFPSSSSK